MKSTFLAIIQAGVCHTAACAQCTNTFHRVSDVDLMDKGRGYDPSQPLGSVGLNLAF